MSQPQLFRNASFEDWDNPTTPSVWQQTSVVATTLSELRETNPTDHPARAVFSRKPYVYGSRSSLRATLTAAAVAGDFTLRQPNASVSGVIVQPLDRFNIVVAGRCNVLGNLLRIRVILLVGTTDTLFLEPVGNTAAVATNYRSGHGDRFTWNTSARDIDVVMHDAFEEFTFEVNVPVVSGGGVYSLAVRVGNGSAGTQVIDLGGVYLREQQRVKVA